MSDNNVQRCLACGAPLDAPVQGGKVKCKFCGGINIVHAHERKRVMILSVLNAARQTLRMLYIVAAAG